MTKKIEIEEPEYRREARRAERLVGYLNDLLRESLPESASDYEVVHERVNMYRNEVVGPGLRPVNLEDQPTYEFYVKPVSRKSPRKRVMIVHGPDLRERIPGGITNERGHFQIPHFRENLETAIRSFERKY